MNNRIFIIGGGGYVGSSLTRSLLNKNYFVTIFDLFIYGEKYIEKHKNLKLIHGDIRDISHLKKSIINHDIVVHLACISNDPSFELNPKLGKSINYDCFGPFLDILDETSIKHLIYASSSSVYGLKREKNVVEDSKLEPLTDYSLFKKKCEELLIKKNSKKFNYTILRPATVCGHSPRQRFDVVVNILTNIGFHKRELIVHGGNQLRPNIHIKDMVRAYELLITTNSNKIHKKIYNVGSQNISVNDIAQKVKRILGEDLVITKEKTNDNRSYHISSKKIFDELNFICKYDINDAISDLKDAFERKLFLNPLENDDYFNIKKMQSIKIK